ncbi:MAG: Acylphosphate phosphohydrolase, putative, partial [uncultured Actinomycetospora sp.]
ERWRHASSRRRHRRRPGRQLSRCDSPGGRAGWARRVGAQPRRRLGRGGLRGRRRRGRAARRVVSLRAEQRRRRRRRAHGGGGGGRVGLRRPL